MKKIILISMMFLTMQLYGQRDTICLSKIFPLVNNKIFYQGVVKLNDSLGKEYIYDKLKQIVVSVIKSDKNIIQNENKEIGVIQANGFIVKGHNSYIENPQIWYIIKIEVKNGRFRYTISDFTYKFDVKVSTELYGNTISNNKNYNQSFEEWINPTKKRGGLDRKEIEKFLDSVNSELLLIIDSLKIKIEEKKSDSW